MVKRELCTGCGACGAVCQAHAVQMQPDREGFLYPEIDPALCTGCGRCAAVCPAERPGRKGGSRSCFGARAADEAVRGMGSSGGIFPLLASHVLKQGGAVFGAALTEDHTVRHICVRQVEELPRITRTKYVQSDLSQVWNQLGPLTREGTVLFCGTPCQTDAVRSFLGGERERVILADLICYGVPSPGIWKQYVGYLEKKRGGPLGEFRFRDKRAAHGRACSYQAGGREYIYPLWQDPFCQSYFRNVNIRPACFRCPYATMERISDLTLGDFWGIERVRPGFDDAAGCSLILCHTDQGMQLWEEVREQTRWFACGEGDAANPEQPRLRTPTCPSPRRALYMGLYGRVPFPLWLKFWGGQTT